MSKQPKEYLDHLDAKVAFCLKLIGDLVNHRRNALCLSQDRTATQSGMQAITTKLNELINALRSLGGASQRR